MGGASSVLPGQAEVDGRRRREMLAGTPIASMLATDDLAAFAATFQPIIIAPNSMVRAPGVRRRKAGVAPTPRLTGPTALCALPVVFLCR